MNCPNCKQKMTCGCQKRSASNGATVCSNCITAYEASLTKGKAVSGAPIITGITYIPPKA